VEPVEAIEACIEMCGGLNELAKELEVTAPAICYWRKTQVPKSRVPQLVALSENRLTETDFRPDLNWNFIKQWAKS
jgi:DNA-binding transcriptional regulator YdaS (Cro superfamily)